MKYVLIHVVAPVGRYHCREFQPKSIHGRSRPLFSPCPRSSTPQVSSQWAAPPSSRLMPGAAFLFATGVLASSTGQHLRVPSTTSGGLQVCLHSSIPPPAPDSWLLCLRVSPLPHRRFYPMIQPHLHASAQVSRSRARPGGAGVGVSLRSALLLTCMLLYLFVLIFDGLAAVLLCDRP